MLRGKEEGREKERVRVSVEFSFENIKSFFLEFFVFWLLFGGCSFIVILF